MPAKKTDNEKKSSAVKKPVKTSKPKAETAPLKESGAPKKFTAALGKRKNASASARAVVGNGTITVNGKKLEEYFNTATQIRIAQDALKQVGDKKLDFSILVKGGGKNGQAEAARLAIAKCLVALEADLRPVLKAKGWLKRDPRIKERKKPGLKRARRAPQWSKR